MLTHSAPHTEQRPGGASTLNPSDRRVPATPSLEGRTDAPTAPFSRVAATLRLDAAVLDAVLERLPVGLLVVRRDGGIVYANEAARVLRLTDDGALGWTVARAVLSREVVHGEEIESRAPGRASCRLSIDVIPDRRAGGSGAAVVTVADVTAQREALEWRPVIESLMSL
jgi:PAS domain-containing protein